MKLKKPLPRLGALLLLALLVGCQYMQTPESSTRDPREQRDRDLYGTVEGTNGFTLFGGSGKRDSADSGNGSGGIGVNAYLWRGALDTMDFMPLASADPFGGLIITDWYQPVQTPKERLKVQVQIRDTVLRADGVKVTVFRQTQDPDGHWLDAPVDPSTSIELEDKILTRARQLRITSLQAAG
jgi:hypothetical protein